MIKIGYLYRRKMRKLGFYPTKQGYKTYKKLKKKWFKQNKNSIYDFRNNHWIDNIDIKYEKE